MPPTLHAVRCICILTALPLLLGGCGQVQRAPSSANGYSIVVVGGTTNFDSSYFYPYSAADAPGHELPVVANRQSVPGSIRPQAGLYTGVNFYVAITQDGGPLTENATLTFEGPEGPYRDSSGSPANYRYAAGNYWSEYLFFEGQDSGTYRVTANIGNTRLQASTTIDLGNVISDQPTEMRVGATPGNIGLAWDATPGAAAYLAFAWGNLEKANVWLGLTKDNWIVGDATLDSDGTYDVTLVSTAWDVTAPYTEPYPGSLPATFNAAAVARTIVWPDIAELYSTPTEFIVLSNEIGQSSEQTLEVRLLRGQMSGYWLNIADAPANLAWNLPSTGIIFDDAPLTTTFNANCSGGPSQDRAFLDLETTAEATPRIEMPVLVECTTAAPTISPTWDLNGTVTATRSSISQDGTKLASYESFDLVIRDAASGDLLRSTYRYDLNGATLAWGPGNQLALPVRTPGGFAENGARVEDAMTGAEIRAYPADHPVTGLVWSRDGSRLAGYDSQSLTVWEAGTGTVIRTFDIISPAALFSPDASQIAIASGSQSSLAVFDLDDGSQLWSTMLDGNNTSAQQTWNALAWEPDGNRIAATSSRPYRTIDGFDGELNVWDATTGELLVRNQQLASGGNSLTWRDDGTLLNVGGDALILSPFSGRILSQQALELPDYPNHVAANANGSVFAIYGGSPLQAWSVSD